MKLKLMTHQIDSVKLILDYKKVGIFTGTGSGKTIIGKKAIQQVKPKNILICCTVQMIKDNVWTNIKNAVIISYNRLSTRYKEYINQNFDFIICDEAHKIKSEYKKRQGCKISRLIYHLSRRAKYCIAMTGTPVGNDYIDIYNIFNNIDCDLWQHLSKSEFIERFYYYKNVDYSGRGFKVPVLLGLKPKMKKIFHEELATRSIILSTEEAVVELKKIKRHHISVFVDDIHNNKNYKQIKKGIVKYKNRYQTLPILERRDKEHQACQGFYYNEFDKEPIVFSNNKIKKLEKMIRFFMDKNEKIVISYHFQYDKELIINLLKTLKLKYARTISEFVKRNIFLLHFSQGESLNLQHLCHIIIFYSYNYSFLSFEQLCGRIYRKGQIKDCFYFMLISRNTLEQDYVRPAIFEKQGKLELIQNYKRLRDGK